MRLLALIGVMAANVSDDDRSAVMLLVGVTARGVVALAPEIRAAIALASKALTPAVPLVKEKVEAAVSVEVAIFQ